MSDKQRESKDNSTTYHAQMRHQSKNKLELHDQSEYKLKSLLITQECDMKQR